MSTQTASPWDQEVATGGGLYLKIEPNTSVRMRIVGKPIQFQEEYQGKVSDKWAVAVIEKTPGPDKSILKAVKGFKFGPMIFKAIQTLWRNEEWGDPEDYDITVTRTGSDKETKYSVVPSPKKPLSDEDKVLIEEASLDLVKLFVNNSNGSAIPAASAAGNGEYDPFAEE